ncbi:MAG: type II toxin-antitoxin system Phd/YefM family antitoxin [Planctomycetes bacterium]|nr:type II toxin-antitoxin system Phd/YefM family antitoxin [Planctomycetota bacterium]
MERVGLTEFRRHLGRYLAQVRKGETVVLLAGDRPVAEVRPARTSRRVRRAPRPRADDAIVERLVRKGIGKGPTGRVSQAFLEKLKNSPPLAPDARLSEAVDEEREESW